MLNSGNQWNEETTALPNFETVVLFYPLNHKNLFFLAMHQVIFDTASIERGGSLNFKTDLETK